ncbi:MAG: clan AA aspartic protease [Alistipes sp.]|nr:clan AA aspartic protease [Alistipes sp.]
MRRLLTTLAFVLCATFVWAQREVTPQQANDEVNDYISRGDYVTLSRELPALREVIVPHLLKLADAFVAYSEGRHEESNQHIAELEQYRKELGDGVVTTMQNIAYYNALAMEDYAAASRYLSVLIEAAPSQRATLEAFKGWMDALADRKIVAVKRRKRKNSFPIECRPMGDGVHLMVEAQVGRESVEMIFDTGCCNANCITAEAAERLGVKILVDSLPLGGVGGSTYAKVGVLPKMKVGDVVIKNPTFFVVESIVDNPAVKKVEAVLGTHVIRAMGEMQIDLEQNIVTLPTKQSEPHNRNLSFHQGNYGIAFSYEGMPLVAHFDTGRVKSDLSQRFYLYFRTMVDSVAGERVKSSRSGIGGSRECEVVRLPQITLNVADRAVTFGNVDVITAGYSSEWDGVMGADLLKGAGTTTLDLKKMYFRIDK